METTVLLAVAILFIAFTIGRKLLMRSNPNVKNVSADEAHKLIAENTAIVIMDVRTKKEYDSGHIFGAILIPVNELSGRVNEFTACHNKPILVYCASGGRSPGAVRILLRNNFAEIYHMHSGISSWKYGLQVS